MSEKKILIFGAASGIGKIILHRFSENKDFTVFAQTTNKNKFEKLNKKYDKVTFLHDSLEDKEATLKYAKGVDHVLIILSEVENKSLVSEEILNVLEEIENLKHVVLLSVLNLDNENIGTSHEYKEIEEELKDNDKFKYTILRTVFFQENLLDWRKTINSGKLRLPIKDSRIPLLSSRDVAEASSKIFSEGESHYGKTYELIGPDPLDGKQIASALSFHLGKDIIYESCDPKVTAEDLKEGGLEEWKIESRIELLESIADGLHNDVKVDKNNLVEKPIKFYDYVKNNVNKFNKGANSVTPLKIEGNKVSPKTSPKSSPRKSPKNQPNLSPREKQPGAFSCRILKAKGLKKGNYFVQVSLPFAKKKFKTEGQTEKKSTDPIWDSPIFSTSLDNSREETVVITLFQKGIFNTAKGEIVLSIPDLKTGVPYRKWEKISKKEKEVGEIQFDILFANFNDKNLGTEFDWPIHTLLKKKNFDGVQTLIDLGEDRVGTDNNGYTALMLSAKHDMPLGMKLLLDRTKSSIEAKNNEGQSALHLAAQYSGECVELLLSKDADLKHGDSKGLKPLHIAAQHNNGSAVYYLLKKGVDVNEKAGDAEDTPLHFAILNNSFNVFKHLADFKVDPFVLNKEKKTAVSYLFKEKAKDPTSESGSMISLYDGAPSKIDEQTRVAVLEAFDLIDPREFLCQKTHKSRVQFEAKPINSHFTLKSSQFCVYSKGKSADCKVLAHLNEVVGLQNEKIGAVISKWSDKSRPIYKEPSEVRNVIGITSEEPLRVTFEADTYYIIHLFTKYKEDKNETANFIIYTNEETKDTIQYYELKDWEHKETLKSEWKGENARGPQPNEDWFKNPNFKLTLPKEKDIKFSILLSQNRVNTDSDFVVTPYSVFIGFYIYNTELDDNWGQCEKWLNSRDVFQTLDWDGTEKNELVIVPATHKEGTEKGFTITVYCTHKFSFESK